jgi:hypothetical protein
MPDGELTGDRRVTLYWEVYGREAVEPPRVTVTISRMRASRARRLAEAVGLRDTPQTVQMEWETDAPAGGTAAGSVTLELGDRPTGTWRVSVRVATPAGGTATASRDLTLSPR